MSDNIEEREEVFALAEPWTNPLGGQLVALTHV